MESWKWENDKILGGHLVWEPPPPATQFWDVYFISNQQTKTISELWDGAQLRCDFRRTFTEDLMAQWHEVVAIAESITLT